MNAHANTHHHDHVLSSSLEGLDKVPHFGEFESIRIEGHDPSTVHVVDIQPLSLERDPSGRVLYDGSRWRSAKRFNSTFGGLKVLTLATVSAASKMSLVPYLQFSDHHA